MEVIWPGEESFSIFVLSRSYLISVNKYILVLLSRATSSAAAYALLLSLRRNCPFILM